jgi:hypothetical protein
MEANENDLMSLDDVLNNQNAAGRPFKTFLGYNTGNRTFSLFMTLFEVQEYTEVANEQSKNSLFVSQRKLDLEHAQKIATYLLKGLIWTTEKKAGPDAVNSSAFENIKREMGTQPYMSIPPLVASFRNCLPDGSNLKVVPLKGSADGEIAAYKIFVNPGDTFWVIDGQHRKKGIELVHDFLKYVTINQKYPARASLFKTTKKDDLTPEELKVWNDCLDMMKKCTVSLEVHLGLDAEKERQLFHDLNNFSKKVDKNLALNFDGSNTVNIFTGEVVINDIFSDVDFAEAQAKDSNDWKVDGFTRQELVSINALLFLNKTNVNGATPSMVEPKKDIATAFWRKIVEIPGLTEDGSKQKTVAAQRVILKALAKLVYDFAFGKFYNLEHLNLILDSIPALNFNHDNPAWRYYTMTEKLRKEHSLNGLENYLPSDSDGANRDLGNYDQNAKVFRFGSKHNDIYPIIGDIIRWELGLPSRKKQQDTLPLFAIEE